MKFNLRIAQDSKLFKNKISHVILIFDSSRFRIKYCKNVLRLKMIVSFVEVYRDVSL